MRAFYLVAAIALALAESAIIAVDLQSGWAMKSDSMEFYQFGIGTMLIAWLIKDPKLPYEDRPSFDHAFLHLIFFPFFAFYQQFRTRRWWGVAIVCGLLSISLAPWMIGIAIAVSR